ncbi:MAG: hypothetical protein U0P30_06180 [Vicinamibacterales bacterium]
MTVRRAVFLLVVALLVGVRPVRPVAQSGPTALPRVFPNDLTYLGSFSLPDVDGRGGQLSYGGDALGLSADGRTLYFSCIYGSSIAQVEIPGLGQQARVTVPCEAVPNLKTVNPVDPNNSAGGVLQWNGRVIVSGYSTYDAGKLARTSHFAGPSIPALRGPVAMGTDGAGLVAGYMGIVPAEWRGVLGGAALSGQCCISIISRTSYGPSVSVFDPSRLDGTGDVPSTMLVGYPEGHTTLGPYESAGPFFGGAARVGGVAFPAGTRSVLFVGRLGTTYCYGHGTTDRSLDRVPDGKGSRYCYDPTNQYQGNHGYPYKHQIWAYDAADLAAVVRGERAPWDVTPYAAWTLTEMSPGNGVADMRGATYDPVARRLYVTTTNAPVVHVYEVTAGVSGVPTEVCGDGIDNDGNGQIDEGCPPPDTTSPPPAPPGETPGGGTGDGGGDGGSGDGGGTGRGGESGGDGSEEPDAPPTGRPPRDGDMGASGVVERMSVASSAARIAAVAACDARVHAVFGDAALYYRQSIDDGHLWRDAVSLGDGQPAGPRAVACDGAVVALAARRDRALWMWTSRDGGDTWAPPELVADDVSTDAAVAVHDGEIAVAFSARTSAGWQVAVRAGHERAWAPTQVIAEGGGGVPPAVALDDAGRLVAWQDGGTVRVASPWQTGATAARFAAGGALLDATANGPLVVDAAAMSAIAQVNDAGRLQASAAVAPSGAIDAANVRASAVVASWRADGVRFVATSSDGGRSWRSAPLGADGVVSLAIEAGSAHALVVDDRGAVHYARVVIARE